MAPLLAREGIHHHMRWTHHSLFDRLRRLQSQQFLEQRFIQRLLNWSGVRQHEVRLGAVHLDLRYSAGIHHRQVGPQLATDLFIGTVQFVLE